MPFSSADPNAYLALAMQAAKGTPNAGATKFRFQKYLSGTNLTPELTVQDIREGGDGLDYGFTYKQMQKITGQLVLNGRPEMLGQILQFTPGMATWDGASAPGLHTFSTAGASHPWATIETAFPGTLMLQTISDVRFTAMTLEAMAGEPLKVTAPFIGITQNASSAGFAPTYISEAPFLYYNTPSYQLDGTADTTIESWKVDLKYGVEELSAQSVQLDEAVVQNRDIDFELVRRIEDRVLWGKIYTGAGGVPTQSVATGSFRGIVTYGAGAAARTLDVFLPLLSYRGGELTELDPDGKTIRQTVTAQALKGATWSFIAKLSNAHASAYAS
jgi:hypothetical protein